MPEAELRHEIEAGVGFWGYLEDGRLRGVMGIQEVQDVTLIRHAYVAPAHQRRGIGSALLNRVGGETTLPILIGTWADADWAVRFYQNHGFRLVPAEATRKLLQRYWSVPDRQIETSVVLADPAWFAGGGGAAV
jgi:GNAT superfamily N-acetyltransferase